MQAVARPVMVAPRNGVLIDLERIVSRSTTHDSSGSITVTSAAAPGDRCPPSTPIRAAGLADR